MEREDANYLAWLEDRDWSELEAGQRVVYKGRVWTVHSSLGDDRYTLRSVRNRWERTNADRIDIVVGFQDRE